MAEKHFTLPFSVLELDEAAGKWSLRDFRLDYPSKESLPFHCYVFLSEKDLPSQKEESEGRLQILRQVLTYFNVPVLLTSKLCDESNGYFGCQHTDDKDGKPEDYTTWFRCLVKDVFHCEISNKSNYKWHEMGFFTRWVPGHSICLCIGVPDSVKTQLKDYLSDSAPLSLFNPFALHVPMIDQMILLYDNSVWLVRNLIRRREKIREAQTSPFLDVYFSELHEIARHTIHSSETLAVTLNTVTTMKQKQHDVSVNIISKTPAEKEAYKKVEEYMEFQLQMTHNLKLRAWANQERLKNEITLAFNMITQRDSAVMVEIGHATKNDSTAMTTVAIVTMAFLPATFISTIFSMSFFNFTPGNGTQKERWTVSKKFWLYWVITLPLTALTIATWSVWQNRKGKRIGMEKYHEAREARRRITEMYSTNGNADIP